jgi:cell division protein FtsZ
MKSNSLEFENFALVIGVGGGGGNALESIYESYHLEGSNFIDFFAINTDVQALNNIKIPIQKRLLIGEHLTKGLGAGSDPEKGRLAALESQDLIRNSIDKDYKIIFIIAGMGGGTGTGASPIVAKICQELKILTVALLSTPFTFEGVLRQKQAGLGIHLINKYADSIFLFSNDNILNEHSNIKLSDAFKYSDAIFKSPIDVILGIVTRVGYVNVDFEDIKTVLTQSGYSTIAIGEGEGKDRIKQTIEQLRHSPFTANVNFSEIKFILIQIESGDDINMDDIFEITEYFHEEVGDRADLIWGNSFDPHMKNEVRVNAILTGVSKDQVIEYFNPGEIEIEKKIPSVIEKEVKKIWEDFKGKKIAFLIMQFGKGAQYEEIKSLIKKSLRKYGIVVLRADDKEYHNDLYYNTLSYIYACDFGIAIFERIQDESFNPNVAFEVGFMHGINKHVCNLKDSSMAHLHTDIMGKLYREFDIHDIENTLVPNLIKWIRDKEIFGLE